MIKYVNLAEDNKQYLNQFLIASQQVILSGNYILGPKVKKLEQNISRYIGTKYAVAVNSGTDALIFSLLALGIKKDDEIITVPNTFIATVAAIKNIGAKIVFADIDDDGLISIEDTVSKISERTKAIIVVHLGGRIVDVQKLKDKIPGKYHIPVVEDCAQSFGGKLYGKMAGNLGDIAALSFHPLKNLGALGDAGMVLTSDKHLYSKLTLLRNHGLKDRNHCSIFGYNSRIDELQATFLNIKLKNFESDMKKRKMIALTYEKELKGHPIVLPTSRKGEVQSYNYYIIQIDKRNELLSFLLDNGIEAKIHYPLLIYKQKAYDQEKIVLENAEKINKRILSLPIYPSLLLKDVTYITETIKKFLKENN